MVTLSTNPRSKDLSPHGMEGIETLHREKRMNKSGSPSAWREGIGITRIDLFWK